MVCCFSALPFAIWCKGHMSQSALYVFLSLWRISLFFFYLAFLFASWRKWLCWLPPHEQQFFLPQCFQNTWNTCQFVLRFHTSHPCHCQVISPILDCCMNSCVLSVRGAFVECTLVIPPAIKFYCLVSLMLSLLIIEKFTSLTSSLDFCCPCNSLSFTFKIHHKRSKRMCLFT